MEPLFAFLALFILIGLLGWKYFETRNRERMAMIEKGLKPADIKPSAVSEWLRPNHASSLKWGILTVSVGAGVFVANILERLWYFHDSIYLATMLVFGGTGLIIFYLIASRKKEQ